MCTNICCEANGGIGFELAAQLMAKGSYHVLVGSRSEDKGNAAVKDLRSRNLPGSSEFIQLDVTNDESIERAAANVERNHGKLDMLVNNAGIGGLGITPLRKQMLECFDTNAAGTEVVTKTFENLLKKSTAPARIVNVSTGLGSIERRLDQSSPYVGIREIQYRASKAAMNMVTACHHIDYAPFGIKVFAYCPGFTVSNLGPHNTKENGAKPVADGASPLVDILEGKRDDDVGKFLHNTGVYPW